MQDGTMTPSDIYFNMSRGGERSATTMELTNPVVPKTQKAMVQQEISRPGQMAVSNLPLLGLLFMVGLLIGAKYIFEGSGS